MRNCNLMHNDDEGYKQNIDKVNQYQINKEVARQEQERI